MAVVKSRRPEGALAIVKIAVSRVRALFASPLVCAHLFAPAERRYCESARDAGQRYAARLAAKLAFRALSSSRRPPPWSRLRVGHGRLGAPILLERRERWRALRGAALTLSHDGDVAVAVLMVQPPAARPR